MRLLIEPEIARLAAVRGTPAEIDAILAAHAAAEPGVFDLEHDIAFHGAVAAACHNALAANLLAQILELTRDEAFRTRLPAYTDETGWRHHDQIAAAIRDRHAAEAERVMRTHLSAILTWLNGGSAATDREDPR
ncbi:FadR/GntR family transcriptional regulator [Mangrovicoccus ximenensis]|uniref:FadR/GntR family transcriptional regulator n=1 Tax=Mangrovicoccus ximenensis TaxID=1911570 RepID=UPI001375098C|nr:FCD domain-containing protein [Mangrovicoccus ximenensis]